jgi:hypothetical protein
VAFTTNKGIRYASAPPKGNYMLIKFPERYTISGYYGRIDGHVKQLGFLFAKTVYPAYGSKSTVVSSKSNNLGGLGTDLIFKGPDF